MKKLLILLTFLISTLYAEHTILVSGMSQHGNTHDRYGEKFNDVHYGLGYQYSDYKPHDKVFCTSTIIAMNDSYDNTMYSAVYAVNYMLKDTNNTRISVGMDFGLVYKQLKYYNADTDTYSFSYGVIPVIFIPTVTVEIHKVSLNFTYVPEITHTTSTKHLKVEEVLYVNIGYRF